MWPLKHLRCFCDTPEEWHAICSGVGDGLRPWCSQKMAVCLYAKEWHYYSAARGITTALWLAGIILGVRL